MANCLGRIRQRRWFEVASWAAVALVCALIYMTSARTGDDIVEGGGLVSWVRRILANAAVALVGHPVDVSPVGHFVEYLVLGTLLANALLLRTPLPQGAIAAAALSSIYGISDELHQLFVPGRSCDPMDWLVDTVAAAMGAALVAWLVSRKARRE